MVVMRLYSPVALTCVAVLVLAFSAAPAKAACGDYVHVGNSVPTEEPGKPCTGPNCSSKPDLPPSPLAPLVISIKVHEPLSSTMDVPAAQQDSHRLIIVEASHLPEPVVAGIFHPPRFV
jgi:hypothetical protein